MTDTAAKPLDQSALHLLHRAVQVTEGLFQREIVASGLTPRQFVLMAAIAASEGASQTELVSATGMDRSTLADVVRRLVNKGLIERERRKTDARAYEVSLTAKGRKALEIAMPEIERVEAEVIAALPGERAQQFREDLRTIVEKLSQVAAEDSAPPRGSHTYSRSDIETSASADHPRSAVFN